MIAQVNPIHFSLPFCLSLTIAAMRDLYDPGVWILKDD